MARKVGEIERAGKAIWMTVGTTHTPFAPSRRSSTSRSPLPPPRLRLMSDKDIADVATGLFPLFDAVIANRAVSATFGTGGATGRHRGRHVDRSDG